MNIKFDEMDGRPRKLYEAMWKGFDFEKFGAEISKTYSTRYEKESDNSYCFVGEEDKRQTIIKTFGIENVELFSEKYKMATDGSGSEKLKISTLHSSSLCALLHFYNVTENNKLILKLSTDKNERIVRFKQSFFEYKSPVINNPSNMDVVLLGEDVDCGQDVVLLLESKFSEYFLGASSVFHNISSRYLDNKYSESLYNDDLLRKIGMERTKVCNGFFNLKSNDGQFYIGGIKQMISHYIGVKNVIDGNIYDEKHNKLSKEQKEVQEKVNKAITNEKNVIILGEIVFDSIIGNLELRPKVKCGSAYHDKYCSLIQNIADLEKNNKRLEIIMEPLDYHKEFKANGYEIEPKIKEFYRYGNDAR